MNLKSLFNKILPRKEAEKAQPPLAISWALVAALCIGLVCALGWAFFMGLMVGRGQNPQASIESMSGLGRAEPPAAPEPAPFLEPEPPQTPEPAATTARHENAAPPAPPVRQEKARALPKASPAAKTAPAQKYDYKFQASALRTQAEAQKMSATLKKNGIRSTVQKNGKVYLVLISLRGGSSEVAELQRKMKSLRMGKPMQLSRKAVGKDRRK